MIRSLILILGILTPLFTSTVHGQNVAFSNQIEIDFNKKIAFSNKIKLDFTNVRQDTLMEPELKTQNDKVPVIAKSELTQPHFNKEEILLKQDEIKIIDETVPVNAVVDLNTSIINKDEASKVPSLIANVKNDESDNLPKYYALLLGVSDYVYSNARLNNLENPVLDIEVLSKTLMNYNFKKENILVLKNPTRADVIDELDQLSHIINEKDNFLIFYAGHGIWDDNLNVGYWLPSDAQLEKKSTWISNSNLKDYVAGIKARHTMLISDACFSGSIFKARAVASGINELGISQLYKLPSRKAMTSGNLNTTPDKSIFFEFLNKRLLQNEEKFLSSRELYYSLYKAVINNTNTIPQYGVIQDTGDEGGEFIFIKTQD